jgi:hypothetical protein
VSRSDRDEASILGGIHLVEHNRGQLSSWSAAAFCIASTVLCLLVLEIGYRIVSGVDILRFGDWRAQAALIGEHSFSTHDPVVGWVAKSNTAHTINYGIRKNNLSDSTPRIGGILAVGDSYTFGSGVNDGETWPAQLEHILGMPVVNASAGGWGIDQQVLRYEQLTPIVKPKIAIVGGGWE